jgi:hypothetical protein
MKSYMYVPFEWNRFNLKRERECIQISKPIPCVYIKLLWRINVKAYSFEDAYFNI